MDNYDRQVDMAQELFLRYDQPKLIAKFALEADDHYLYMTFLNTPYRICRSTGAIEEHRGNTWQACRDYSTVMTIFDLLCYHEGELLPPPDGRWCTVGTFIVAGITDTEPYTRRYAQFFDGRLEALRAACEALGGILQAPMAGADLTCLFPVTSFFSVLLQFWAGDEDFPPRVLILWDPSAKQILRFETTFYLQGDLLNRLRNLMI